MEPLAYGCHGAVRKVNIVVEVSHYNDGVVADQMVVHECAKIPDEVVAWG